MAVSTPTIITTGSNAFSADIVTSAVNIPDGDTCFVFIFNDTTGNSNGCSDDSGLTWTEEYASTDQRIRYFSTTGDSGSSSATITVTHTGPCGIHVVNAGNADLTPVQTAEITSSGGANKSMSFSSAVTAGNDLLGWIGHTATRTTTSDNTELSNFDIGTTATTASEHSTTGSTLSWTHSGAVSATYGIENEETGGVTGNPWYYYANQ